MQTAYAGPRATRKRRYSSGPGAPTSAVTAGKGYSYFKRSAVSGPLRWPTAKVQPPYDRALVKVKSTGSISSSAGGTIGSTFSLSGCTATTDWASYVATFDAFTVYGIKLTLLAAQPGQDSKDATRGNLITYIDMDSTAGVATVALAFNYSSAIIHVPLAIASGKITRQVWVPANRRPKVNSTSGGFNASNDDTSIQVVGDSFGATILYFYVAVEWFIEFTNQR